MYMALQKKVLRKQGDKFQLVDKDQELGVASPTQSDSTMSETRPERYETDHWEELRISVRKKYEAQKQKTRAAPPQGPDSPQGVGSGEQMFLRRPILAAHRPEPVCHDDIALLKPSKASHGGSGLRRVQSTGSIRAAYAQFAADCDSIAASAIDYRIFCRFLFPEAEATRKSQPPDKERVREVVASHPSPRYQRKMSFERFKRRRGATLPDVPEVPEIPSVFRNMGRASSAVFQSPSGQADIMIDTSKHSWPQSGTRPSRSRPEIPHAMASREMGCERDFSPAMQTRNSFAYDVEKEMERRGISISTRTNKSRLRENTEGTHQRWYAHELENEPEYKYQATGIEGSVSERSKSHEKKRASSSPLPVLDAGGRRALGRSSGDEPRILLNSGNIPFTPRRFDARTSSHSHSSSAHRSSPPEPPLRSILKRPGSAESSSSSNPFSEQIETSPSPTYPRSVLPSHGLPFPTTSNEKHNRPSQGLSPIYKHSPGTRSQQSLTDAERELPLRAFSSSISQENPSTPPSESGRSEKTVIVVRPKLEARSPYANRPSPRTDAEFEELDDEHSVKTSAALINILRAGPPPRFETSETLPIEETHRGRRPNLNKKRSFKELCKDIVQKTQPGSPEQPNMLPSKPTSASAQGSSTSSQRSRSLPRKVEEVFGSIGRNIRQSTKTGEDKKQFDRDADNGIPIELQTPGVPQSSLPDLSGREGSSKPTCDSCKAELSQDQAATKKTWAQCRECGAALFCTHTRDCRLRHAMACPVVQRPHTSYRMHSKFVPEDLKNKGVYIPWQRGNYIEMQKHLQESEAVFTPQMKSGKGGLIKEFRKELGWSKSMQNKVATQSNEMLEDMYERFLRRVFMMPLLESDPADPDTKHPIHKYHRMTAMLRCVECKGHCANCGVDCCVHRAIEMDVKKRTLERKELNAMQMIKAEIDTWVRRGNPSIFAQCTECVAEGNAAALYCPNCFGVCPLGQRKNESGPVCGDILCAKHQSVLNAPCDWHGLSTQPATTAQASEST